MLPHRQANPSPHLARPGQAEFGQHESGQDWQAKHNLPFYYAGLDTNDGIRYRLQNATLIRKSMCLCWAIQHQPRQILINNFSALENAKIVPNESMQPVQHMAQTQVTARTWTWLGPVRLCNTVRFCNGHRRRLPLPFSVWRCLPLPLSDGGAGSCFNPFSSAIL